MTGDPVLAAAMKRINPKAPVEKIQHIDYLATAFNREAGHLKEFEHVARLVCGHKVITKNFHRAACKECHEMILNGEDYHVFKYGDACD